MSGFLDSLERARGYLERQGRVSLHALERELGLDTVADDPGWELGERD